MNFICMMCFSYSPDDKPPRVIRYVEPGLMDKRTLSIYDEMNNLLLVNDELFRTLTPVQQEQVLRTHEKIITIMPKTDQMDMFQDWPADEGDDYSEAAE